MLIVIFRKSEYISDASTFIMLKHYPLLYPPFRLQAGGPGRRGRPLVHRGTWHPPHRLHCHRPRPRTGLRVPRACRERTRSQRRHPSHGDPQTIRYDLLADFTPVVSIFEHFLILFLICLYFNLSNYIITIK